jgi:hypothetical protein
MTDEKMAAMTALVEAYGERKGRLINAVMEFPSQSTLSDIIALAHNVQSAYNSLNDYVNRNANHYVTSQEIIDIQEPTT